MAIADTDLVVYGSANMQESDSGTQGGAIDTAVKVVFTDIAATDSVSVVSDNAGDTTQTVTIYGRDSGGSIVSEAETLTGTTRVTTAQSFERILKVTLSGTTTGTITVARNNNPTYTAIGTMEAGITTLRRPFYDVSADVPTGSSRDFYEKIFVQNDHATLSLLSAEIQENADPSGNVTFALEDAIDDTGTSTDRTTAPTGTDLGSSGFDSANKALADELDAATADLAAASHIGIWLKLTLAAGTAPAKTTYTLRATGSSA